MTHPFEWIEPYVDGDLGADDARAFESHLAGCDRCRADVEGLRTIVTRARSLPRELSPSTDHWPAIEVQIANKPRMPLWAALGAGGAVAALVVAAGALIGLTAVVAYGLHLASTDVTAEIAAADAELRQSDLVGAEAAYRRALERSPDDARALEGASYTAFLRGDYDEADRLLERVGDDSRTLFRRALVAQRKGDLDAVRELSVRSGLPAAQVLAAEVYLVDAEPSSAIRLLRPLGNADDDVGRAARGYLAMLDSDDPATRDHAELTAMWALGMREASCEAAAEVIPSMPDGEERNLVALVWAGRAVTSGQPAAAEALLDSMTAPPGDQAWRVVATRAMVDVAYGRNDEALAKFAMLAEAGAPADGLSDALATAAALSSDPGVAEALAGGIETVAASRALKQAGSPTWATVAPLHGGYGRYAHETAGP